MKKLKAKSGPGRPPLHPYYKMDVDEINVRKFATTEDRLNARCAAHMVARRHRKKFDTKKNEETGKFILTVTRVK